MNDIYMLTDNAIMANIAVGIRETRLKQNISQLNLAKQAGISLSSVIRVEEGQIKSFDTLIRVLRTLGRLDVLTPLVFKQPSPNDYFNRMNSKKPMRQRAAKSKPEYTSIVADSEW
ncbi:MAG: helix-turn-helix transcriptional regulator [Bacteroidaceae bacterium]|nr:helix-turn-helix transcriptional regulator [Bacteroidaceae bacterium]